MELSTLQWEYFTLKLVDFYIMSFSKTSSLTLFVRWPLVHRQSIILEGHSGECENLTGNLNAFH